MSKTKWFVRNRKKAQELKQRRNDFVETDMQEILLNWDDSTTSGISGVKQIKIKYGRQCEFEFNIYHMENFQKSIKKHNPNTIVIYDAYDLVTISRYSNSDTFFKMVKKLLKKYNISSSRHELNECFTLDQINEILVELDSLMDYYEEYSILDEF